MLKLEQAQKIIAHLIAWGEISRFELKNFAGGLDWLSLLESSGVITPVTADNLTDAWSLSPEFWNLLKADNEKAVRTALFQVQGYRNYLISILAEGIASAAKQGLFAELESWSGNELLPFLFNINRMLNQLEVNGKRIIDEKADQISILFASLPERQSTWDNWNQLLLGRSARPQDLFDFVLKRFVPYAFPEKADFHGRMLAILPEILLQDDGNAQFINITPAPWNISRMDVQSSISLFDETGKALWDLNTPAQCKTALQDALIEQPFYKAVTQLAINHYRAMANASPILELYLRPGAPLSDVEIFYEAKKIGFLKEWLSVFIQCQECFVATPLTNDQVGNMIENLLVLQILDQSDDNIVLHPDFQSTLMASRLRSIFRPGKLLQDCMIEAIKKNLQITQQQEVII